MRMFRNHASGGATMFLEIHTDRLRKIATILCELRNLG
jgi:hypothetical protein